MADYQLHAGAGHHRSGGHVPLATLLGAPARTIALAFFLVGALADLFAPNFGVLLAGRVFQAISTGMLMPLMQTIAMTRLAYRQATAMGVAGIAMGFAPNIGPTIGGAMSFLLGWRSFFVLLVVMRQSWRCGGRRHQTWRFF